MYPMRQSLNRYSRWTHSLHQDSNLYLGLKPLLLSISDLPSVARYSPPSYQSQPPRRLISHKTSVPPSRSLEHWDLASYRDYADRSGLDKTTTVYVGTAYEYTVREVLKRFGIETTVTGGRGDRGIDCSGIWRHPGLGKDSEGKFNGVGVVVQCKAEKKKQRPETVRELIGVCSELKTRQLEASRQVTRTNEHDPELALYGPDERGADVIGLLVSPQSATPGVEDVIRSSTVPLVFVQVDLDGCVHQMFYNRIAAQQGLSGMGVHFRYREGTKTDAETVLTWDRDDWISPGAKPDS